MEHEELKLNIIEWGYEKGILGKNANPLKQLDKTFEEILETRDNVVSYILNPKSEFMDEIQDGIGDTIVTLIMLASIFRVDIDDCLLLAYNEIKGRTGNMVDGVFVKD